MLTECLRTRAARAQGGALARAVATVGLVLSMSGAAGDDTDYAFVMAPIAPFSQASPGAAPPAPWRQQVLPRVRHQNRFDLVEDDGVTVLRVRSQAAASTLVHPLDADPGRLPILSWRWRVSNVVQSSDFTHKDGDDYAARVYVLFDYPVARLRFVDRVKIALARTLHGAALPSAAIAYVWGTAQPIGATGPNPYTDRVRMIVVESGNARVGEWVAQRRDVAADFEVLFGEPAPRIVGIAVSADTDNTGEAVTSWFGDLRLLARE